MIIMVHDSFHGLFPKIRGKERERGGVGVELERVPTIWSGVLFFVVVDGVGPGLKCPQAPAISEP